MADLLKFCHFKAAQLHKDFRTLGCSSVFRYITLAQHLQLHCFEVLLKPLFRILFWQHIQV